MDVRHYEKIQIEKISNLYKAVLDIQAEFQNTDVQYYYECHDLAPLTVEEWNLVTEKAFVYGVWQMFRDLVPKKTDEYLARTLIDTKIISDIEPLEQRYLSVLNREYSDEFLELKNIGNVLDASSSLGEFWLRNEWVNIHFSYEWYEGVISQYTEFLKACWYFTKTVCGNTSRKNIDLYLKKVSDSIISQNGTNEQSSKESAYKNLCADAKATYPLKGNASDAELVWESACKSEINLWTYWQGRSVRKPKVMLVGQDWGCTAEYPQIIANVEAMNDGVDCRYCDNADLFPTDIHLAELFKVLHYDDIVGTKYDDLFFTNLVLGYRVKGSSGDCHQEWMKRDLKFFYRLVHILQPKVILCLGRNTFEGVLSAFGIDSPIMGLSYNSFIERRKPISIAVKGGASVTVFPLAHCGSLGTMNRNADCGKSSTDLTKQKEDWDYINKYL